MSQSPETRYHAGLEAERAVARAYLRKGYRFGAHRFRGSAGEIDLIMQENDRTIFIEVKKSKTHAQAAEALSDAQIGRIQCAALEYIGQTEGRLDGDMRFDVALVDAAGRVEILENALVA